MPAVLRNREHRPVDLKLKWFSNDRFRSNKGVAVVEKISLPFMAELIDREKYL